MNRISTTLITSSIVFIEWLEYSLYLYLSATIAHQLLPPHLGTSAFVITFGIFAISYLARPLGALCFGLYSDFFGRKKPLIYSALFIALATIGIGLIPSYDSIGILAPILLLSFRLIQSFAISGEFNNSAIFLIEHTPNKQILAGSFIGMASSAGMFCGGLLAFIVGLFDVNINWRIAYVLIGIVTFFFLALRVKLQESPVFINYLNTLKTSKRPSFWSIVKNHKIALIQIAIVASFMSVYIYTCNFFFIAFLQKHNGYSLTQTSIIAATVQGLVTLLTPIVAIIAEKYHFKIIYRIGIILLAIMAPTLFISGFNENNLGIIIGFILYILGNSILTALVFKLMYDFLPTEIRCSSTSFVWSISAALLGSTAPILATYFIFDLKISYFPYAYVVFLAFLAFIFSFVKTNSNHLKEPIAEGAN